MTAGNHQGDKRKCRGVFHQECGRDVAFQMIDADQGKASGKGQRLGRGQPDEQGTDQPRPSRHRDTVDLGQGHPRILQGLEDHRNDRLDMFAGGDFRNDATVACMHLDL